MEKWRSGIAMPSAFYEVGTEELKQLSLLGMSRSRIA